MKSQYYSINGKEYKFDKMVLGQYRQLMEIKVDVDMEDINIKNLISKIPCSRILAICLKPVKDSLMNKDIDKLEQEIDFTFTPTELEEIVSDFFVHCPVDAIIQDMIAIGKSNQLLKQVI